MYYNTDIDVYISLDIPLNLNDPDSQTWYPSHIVKEEGLLRDVCLTNTQRHWFYSRGKIMDGGSARASTNSSVSKKTITYKNIPIYYVKIK